MFIKIINGQIDIAPKDLNTETRSIAGYGDDIELLTEDGYRQATELEETIINSGFAVVVDEVIIDKRNTQEYKDIKLKENKDSFYTQFIKTSKGCIRMRTSVGDFIAILPNYSVQVLATTKLPAGSILFYEEPKFLTLDEELVSYPSEEMNQTEYMLFLGEVLAEYQKIFNK